MMKIEIDKMLQAVDLLYGPNVFIAGGYVRDMTLGVQPSDVDVFIQLPARQKIIYPSLGKGWKLVPLPPYSHAPIRQLWENKETYTYPVQLIFLDLPAYFGPEAFVRAYFDFGLCMCYATWRDEHKRVLPYFLPEFSEDATSKKLTFYYDDRYNTAKRTIEDRGPKLLRKYPNYTVEVKYVS